MTNETNTGNYNEDIEKYLKNHQINKDECMECKIAKLTRKTITMFTMFFYVFIF